MREVSFILPLLHPVATSVDSLMAPWVTNIAARRRLEAGEASASRAELQDSSRYYCEIR